MRRTAWTAFPTGGIHRSRVNSLAKPMIPLVRCGEKLKAWQWRAVCKLVLSSACIGYVVEYIEVLANTGKYPKWGIALTTFGMGVKKGREMRRFGLARPLS